jgi:hypothetical protein
VQARSISLPKLAAALAASELIPILNQASFGVFDLAGAKLNFYLAYSANNAADELFFGGAPLVVSISDYDPLRLRASNAEILDDTVYDAGRDRNIPVLIYSSESFGSSPVILFSHGLGGTRFTAVYLFEQ